MLPVVYKTNHFDNLLHPVPMLSIHPMKKKCNKMAERLIFTDFLTLISFDMKSSQCIESLGDHTVLVRSNKITFLLIYNYIIFSFSKLLQV